MTPTDLDILLVTFFTWSLKLRFSSSVTPRNLIVETFVKIDSRILMSNAYFWLENIIYEVLLTFRDSLLVLSHIESVFSVTRQQVGVNLNSHRMTAMLSNQYVTVKCEYDVVIIRNSISEFISMKENGHVVLLQQSQNWFP